MPIQYRVEHGSYPDALQKLVPEYLDKVALSPLTGKPPVYESDGKAFSLSLDGGKKIFRSEPQY